MHINNALFGVVAEHSARGEKSKRHTLESVQFALAPARLSRHEDYFHTSAAAADASVSIMIRDKLEPSLLATRSPSSPLGNHGESFCFSPRPDVESGVKWVWIS